MIAAGCRHKPKNITPVTGTGAAPTTEYPGGGGPLRPTPPVNTTPNPVRPGVPFNPNAGPGFVDNNSNNPNGVNAQPPVDPNKANLDTTTPLRGRPPEGGVEDTETLKGDTVYFEYDKSAIKTSEYAKVGAVAEYAKSHPDSNLVVEGHCDERGTEEYNRALGERRALAIRERLVNLGVSADKVTTVSYGKDRPVETGHSEDAWSKNRRGQFVLVGPAASLK